MQWMCFELLQPTNVIKHLKRSLRVSKMQLLRFVFALEWKNLY
uniref:Uncharacterized protein n=1 Tax=Arundo donax TaxID=35708 RepID=A0A0A9GGF1_ARUDO